MNKPVLVSAMATVFLSSHVLAQAPQQVGVPPSVAAASAPGAVNNAAYTKDLKQNLGQQPAPQGAANATRAQPFGLEGPKSLGGQWAGGKDVDRGGVRDMQNTAPIRGDNADTFGGQRVNQGKDAGTRSYAGSGKGRTNQGVEDFNTQTDEDLAAAHGSRVLNVDQADRERNAKEAEYSMKVGPDHYRATAHMSDEARAKYWREQAARQGAGGRPREDQNFSAGSLMPLTRVDAVNAVKGVQTRAGAAGGRGDGRTDQQQGGGSNGQMVHRNKAEGAERQPISSAINPDAALKINQVADPVPAR